MLHISWSFAGISFITVMLSSKDMKKISHLSTSAKNSLSTATLWKNDKLQKTS
jgi:hypothetical protein